MPPLYMLGAFPSRDVAGQFCRCGADASHYAASISCGEVVVVPVCGTHAAVAETVCSMGVTVAASSSSFATAREERNAGIFAANRAGESPVEIASKFGLSRQAVCRVLAGRPSAHIVGASAVCSEHGSSRMS